MILETDCAITTGEDISEIILLQGVKAKVFANARAIYAKTGKNSELVLVTFNTVKTHAVLEGDNSKIKTINIYDGKNRDIDIDATSEHVGKNTVSLIKTVGVLSNSNARSRGLIKIAPSAEHSDGYQKSEALILDTSKVISIPDLEIHNDKVKCSHGSTITHIDKEKIFYLQSRGIDMLDAQALLIEGFYESTLNEIGDVRLQEEILEKLRFQ